MRGQHVESGQPVLLSPCEDIAFVANGRTELAEALISADQIDYWMAICRGAPRLDRKYLNRPWKMSKREIIRRGNKLVETLEFAVRPQLQSHSPKRSWPQSKPISSMLFLEWYR